MSDAQALAKKIKDVVSTWSLDVRFPVGTRVRYVPNHAHGDKGHPDCEDGTVSSCNEKYVFVRYGARQHAQATDPEDLVRL